MKEKIKELTEKINVIESKIDILIDDVVEDKMFKSPRAEEKLMSLLLSLKYLKDKKSRLVVSLMDKKKVVKNENKIDK